MKILVLGATGPTGAHFVMAALNAGDSLTVLVRNPSGLDLPTGSHSDVTVVTGDATRSSDVLAACGGVDAIVSTLGVGTSLRSRALFSRASAAVISAAEKTGVERVVWLSSFGVGTSFRDASAVQKVIYSTMLRSVYADKDAAEHRLRASDLDWTIVYPTRLTDGPPASTFRAATRLPMRGNPTISRADVAAFLHDSTHQTAWRRSAVVISD